MSIMFIDPLSYLLNVLLAAVVIVLVITRLAAGRLIRHHYDQKADFFRRWPVQPGDIVFLGDSITDGARWDELFPGLPVKNRGINADTTTGVLSRLTEITAGQPAAVFLLIGTNDLPWYMFRRDDAIIRTYQEILARISAESPATLVFVQSILPRRRRYAWRIRVLNAHIEKMTIGCNCTYIDLFSQLAGEDGALHPDLSNDQLHLLAEGYMIWKRILEPHLDRVITYSPVLIDNIESL
jgi:lysophospholipase L1-like esterase